MGREVLRTDAAPGFALYAQGTKNGSIVCVSGMVGIDPGTGQLAGPTIQEQTRQALANCSAVLEAGNATLDDVLEVGVLLTRLVGPLRGRRAGRVGPELRLGRRAQVPQKRRSWIRHDAGWR
jgi:Endoribonuclease L-PSP